MKTRDEEGHMLFGNVKYSHLDALWEGERVQGPGALEGQAVDFCSLHVCGYYLIKQGILSFFQKTQTTVGERSFQFCIPI